MQYILFAALVSPKYVCVPKKIQELVLKPKCSGKCESDRIPAMLAAMVLWMPDCCWSSQHDTHWDQGELACRRASGFNLGQV